MFRPLLGLTIFTIPFMVTLSASHAQSWQDWSQKNPTYQAPSPAPTPPPANQTTQSTWSNPAPQTNPTSPSNSQNSPQFSTQDPQFEQGLMAGCRKQQLPDSYCQCVLKEIQNNYTFEEVMQIVNYTHEKGEIPSEIMTVTLNCLPG